MFPPEICDLIFTIWKKIDFPILIIAVILLCFLSAYLIAENYIAMRKSFALKKKMEKMTEKSIK